MLQALDDFLEIAHGGLEIQGLGVALRVAAGHGMERYTGADAGSNTGILRMQFTVSIHGRGGRFEKLSSRDTRHKRGVALGRDFSTMARGSTMRHSSKQILGY